MDLSYSKIFERMLKAGKLKNSSQMAKVLGISPQAVSNYKKKGELPPSLVFKFAEIYNVSIDWLITGDGPHEGDSPNKFVYAGESDGIYSASDKKVCPTDMNDLMLLNPDEIIYIGRLLKVLRGPEKFAPAIRVCIDSFIKAAAGSAG